MNTFRTIATVLLAAFLVLGPTVAFAAGETVTVSTNAGNYSGQATIQVTGTVSPAPTVSNTAVVVTTRGPGGVVDTGVASVATSTGDFSYVLVAGSSAWTTGTYSVNATYGGPAGTGSAITTFTYVAGTSTSQVVTVTTTTTLTTTVAQETTTTTTTVPSSDAPALASIQSSLTQIQSSLSGLTTAINTISSGVTSIQSTLGSVSTGISTVSGIGGQLTTLTNNVNNDGTYVLVVAALAAITLVLELAILVRKLS